jgi:hypothetical protein
MMIATELPAANKLLLSDIIGSLSYALDLTEGLPAGHCLRCCWMGMHVGRQYGMDQSALSHLYYTILLKDAGCSSNAARLFEIYETDDRTVKNDFKQVDTESLFQLGKFVMSHVGVGKSLHERVSKMLALVERGEEFAHELVSTRCERGADIARQLGFDEDVALGVRYLDEHWNGKGKPFGLVGEEIPVNARIALLAQVIEVFYAADGKEFAVAEVNKRSGTWFDPALVDAFNIAQQQADFWLCFSCDDLQDKVCQLEPHSKVIEIDEDRLDTIAEAFAKVVDAKSPYTYGHSSRVAAYTLAVAKRMGIPPARQKWLYRAALLHDIGKLGVIMACWISQASLMKTNGSRLRHMLFIPNRYCRDWMCSLSWRKLPLRIMNVWMARVILMDCMQIKSRWKRALSPWLIYSMRLRQIDPIVGR